MASRTRYREFKLEYHGYKSYYDLIGLPINANTNTIEIRLHQLLFQLKPNDETYNNDTVAQFSDITIINNTLSSAHKRYKYDQVHSLAQRCNINTWEVCNPNIKL